jgi:hypothetical protein
MRPHDWFVERRLEYASRTLEPEETGAFEAHLTECEECRREIDQIAEDLKWLPMGAHPVAPRPGFRGRAIAAVLGGRASRRPRPILPAALAASVLLVAAGWYFGSARARALQGELETQHGVVAALKDTLSIMRQAGRILQADVDLGDTQGGVLIFADEVTHRWNVVIHGLPPASAGHRYQFWFICEDSMVRGAEVTVESARPTMFTTGMPEPRSCAAVKGAALTEEPMAEEQGPPSGRSLAHLML